MIVFLLISLIPNQWVRSSLLFLKLISVHYFSMSLFLYPNLCQESMLVQVRNTSSACTGSYSGEMGQVLIQRTVNATGDLDPHLEYTSVRAHDPRLLYFMFLVVCIFQVRFRGNASPQHHLQHFFLKKKFLTHQPRRLTGNAVSSFPTMCCGVNKFAEATRSHVSMETSRRSCHGAASKTKISSKRKCKTLKLPSSN